MGKPLSAFLGALAILVAMTIAETDLKDSETATETTTKDKRSQEDIMFGNQQNKPAGMVDDLLVFPSGQQAKSSTTSESSFSRDIKNHSRSSTEEKTKEDEHPKLSTGSKQDKSSKSSLKDDSSDQQPQQRFDYYDYLQEPDETRLQVEEGGSYPLEPAEPQRVTLPQFNQHDLSDYTEDDYDGVLYRRKRTPKRSAAGQVLRKRSLRSNIEDLLGGNRRLPRRALRLKRDAGVEQLLTWLGMIRRGQEMNAAPRLYDEEMNDIEEPEEQQEMAYFYDLPKDEIEVPELPPGFLESLVAAEGPALSGRNRELPEEDSVIPVGADALSEWMLRYGYPYPSLSRRSPNGMMMAPNPASFYPVDYRYVLVPGGQQPPQPQQKRKRNSGEHHRRLGGLQLQQELEPGKWGGFAHRRRPLETDSERLYALANLLSEESPAMEDLERRKRKAPKA